MDREPAGVNVAGSGTSGAGPGRHLAGAGLAVIVVLLVAVAVLATRLVSAAPTASAKAVAASPGPSATPGLTVPAIYQRVAPSVVAIHVGGGVGTGVIVADSGTIITAAHVVAGASAITVTFADGTVAQATVLSSDKGLDIAMLAPSKLPRVVVPATLGEAAVVGASVVAIGDPYGLTDSVSAGIISGLDRTADTDSGKRSGLIQFDAAVNPGSFGGPLLDSRGMVIGIVVALADPDGQDAFAGIGFAVPIDAALGGTAGSGPGQGPQI